MKNSKNIEDLKKIAVPSLIYIILNVISIFLVEVSLVFACTLQIFSVILYIFLLYLKFKNYKLKYFFLGKRFKEELQKYEKYNNYKNIKNKKHFIKWAKSIYREKGTIFFYEEKTPFSEMWDLYDSYLSSINDCNDIMILCVLNDYLGSGSLYQAFETLVKFCPFDKYKELINFSKIFPQSIKRNLTKLVYEKAYKIIYLQENRNDYKPNDKDEKILSAFESTSKSELNTLTEDISCIFNKVAIENYINKYMLSSLPENCKKLYFSKDKRKRIIIFFDSTKNLYKAQEEIFTFENDLDENEIHSRGFWQLGNISLGLYASLDLVLNDLQNTLQQYTEYNL